MLEKVSENKYRVISRNNVNIREKPDFNSDIKRIEKFNTVVDAINVKDGWLKLHDGYSRLEFYEKV